MKLHDEIVNVMISVKKINKKTNILKKQFF